MLNDVGVFAVRDDFHKAFETGKILVLFLNGFGNAVRYSRADRDGAINMCGISFRGMISDNQYFPPFPRMQAKWGGLHDTSPTSSPRARESLPGHPQPFFHAL